MTRTRSPARRTRLLAALALAGLVSTTAMASPQDDAAHKEAIEQARAGAYRPALATLEQLWRTNISEPRYFHDYIVVLVWARRDVEALALASRVVPEAPAYVHEALGLAARNVGKTREAETHFRHALATAPESLAPVIGIANVQRDTGRLADARQTLDGARARHGDAVDWLVARAHVAEGEKKFADALRLYQKAGQQAPGRADAIAGQARVASRLGAPRIAVELAARHPQAIDQRELANIIGDQIALSVRSGHAAAENEPRAARFARLDAAIANSDPLFRTFTANPASLDANERRILADRLHALSNRFRMREAVALHEQLALAGHDVPAYGKRAAAQAYLYLEQPRKALALFEAADREDPDDFDGRMGHFYALVENERHADAIRHIDRVTDAAPRRIGAWSEPTTRDNPDHLTARVAQANARTYADDLKTAETMVRDLRAKAPASTEVRMANAELDLARGRPRHADAELQSVIRLDEENAGARAERVGALLQVHDFRAAEHEVAEAKARRPEDKRTERAERQWAAHSSPQLIIEWTRGTSRGNSPSGSDDWALDGYLYSPPLAQQWRAFGHTHIAEASFDGANVEWRRIGAGVEYRPRDWRITAELNRSLDGDQRAGGIASARWWADDHLSLAGSLEIQSNAVPMQARLAGISGNRVAMEANYRVHESRSFQATVGATEFSDDNRRDTLSGGWTERWYSGPRLKLDSNVGAYFSHNSREGAPYFNPRSDAAYTGSLIGEWLTWREYSRAFRQRLTATAGVYTQEGFATGPIWGGRYEHAWDWTERFSFRYGVGRLLHPYDGRQTGRNYVNVELDWRM